jgi:hypothetical protein
MPGSVCLSTGRRRWRGGAAAGVRQVERFGFLGQDSDGPNFDRHVRICTLGEQSRNRILFDHDPQIDRHHAEFGVRL